MSRTVCLDDGGVTVRRPADLLVILTVGLTALFVLTPLAPALIGRGTLLDVGLLSSQPPFRAEVGSAYSTVVTCRLDTVDYYLPGIAEIKRSLFAGQFPTWAPYEVGGAPLASLPNHGALSPMSLPYFLLPLWVAPGYVKLLEFVVAVGGMLLYLRRLRLSMVAGLLAGIVFAASGFMVMWTNWPHTRVAALIPALFWALERLLQELRARDVVVVGAVVASMLLGGFPAVVLFSHTVAAAYVLVRVLMLYRQQLVRAGQALLCAAGGVLLGVGLSAIQIIPFAANLSAFDFASRDETGHHAPLYTAFTVLDPFAVGTCVGGARFGPVNPIEAVGFLGGAALVVAATAVVLRRRTPGETLPISFFAISTVALGSAIWLGGPVLAALQVLPLWSTNYVGRAQSVFGFLVAVLVGVGFDRLHRGSGADDGPRLLGGRPVLRASLLAVGLLVVGVLVTAAMIRTAREAGFTDHLLSTMSLPLFVLVGAAACVVIAARGGRLATLISLAVVAVLVVAQSTWFATTLLPTSRVEDFYPDTPTHRYLAQHLGHDRYAARGNVMYAPTSDYYELRTPVGHEFTDQRWKDVLAAADPQVQRTVTYSSFSSDLPMEQVQDSPALDQLAVRYWVQSPRTVVGARDRMPATAGGTVTLQEGSRAGCTVPGGPLRGVRIDVAKAIPRAPEGGRPILHVSVSSGGVQREGSVLVDSEFDPGRLFVAVAGEDLPESPTATLTFWLTGIDTPVVFDGIGDRLSCSAVRPADDRLRLVHADAGGAIYQRLDALPRIRWASTTQLVTDRQERQTLLEQGIPADTVLLEDDDLPDGDGRPATVRVVADERQLMSIQVDAEGAGYLVVADSIARPGWRARVDGRAVDIVHGNHALAAVAVPAGTHQVELTYVAPGLRLGVAVSAVSLVLAAVPVVGPTLARRRRRRRHDGSSELP